MISIVQYMTVGALRGDVVALVIGLLLIYKAWDGTWSGWQRHTSDFFFVELSNNVRTALFVLGAVITLISVLTLILY